jgi:hypothetical protein
VIWVGAAVCTAARLDEPIVAAAASYRLANVLLEAGRLDGTNDVAMQAATTVEPGTMQSSLSLASWGGLLLTAAVACARAGEEPRAWELLGEARAAGRMLGMEHADIHEGGAAADFDAEFSGLIPNSLYTMMTLRVRDHDPRSVTHPSPLGVPNVLVVADAKGNGHFQARLPNPFPAADTPEAANRIINVILLWMSYQRNYGGAIGHHGLGGDVHAQLKMRQPSFAEFVTHS